MQSLRELYRIGAGPSSSHTMGPQRAAFAFREKHPAEAYRVTLHNAFRKTSTGGLAEVLRAASHPM